MDYKKDYLTYTKHMVNKKRYNHTLGVIDSALKLAEIYHEDPDKVRIAASLHDVTKNMDMDEVQKGINSLQKGIAYLEEIFASSKGELPKVREPKPIYKRLDD